jgi:hypothetical protein
VLFSKYSTESVDPELQLGQIVITVRLAKKSAIEKITNGFLYQGINETLIKVKLSKYVSL